MVRAKRIGNLLIEYEVNRRDVKYPRLEFKTGRLELIAPYGFAGEDNLLEKKKDWILRKALEIESAKKNAKLKELSEFGKKELKELVNRLVFNYSKKISAKPDKVYFKKMKTKWGSCSNSKNLTFNTELRFLPQHLIEYVVYHEVLHLVDRKHSDEFWRMMNRKIPRAGQYEKELLEYWFLLRDKKESKECEIESGT